MPNSFAFVCLSIWPLVAIYLYFSRSTVQATLWTILGGLLLLPAATSYKLEMIPVFDKSTVPNLCAFVGWMFWAKASSRISPGVKFLDWLIVAFLLSPVISSLLNSDTVYSGGRGLPGVGLYDGLSAALTQAIVLIPFFLGRKTFRTATDIEEVFRVLAIAGLSYSVLLLWEIRFSPQLHYIVYG